MEKELFKFHKLNSLGQSKAVLIQDLFRYVAKELESGVKECREWTIAKQKLEEACFFAKKAMAIQPENQEKK